MRDEPKSALENVARLERENAELKARIEHARAEEKLEDTVNVRNVRNIRARAAPARMRAVAAITFGIAFGLAMIALTLAVRHPAPGGQLGNHVRGGSAGVCR